MSKKRKRSGQRDTSDIARGISSAGRRSDRISFSHPAATVRLRSGLDQLREIEDRRRFIPEAARLVRRPLAYAFQEAARVVATSKVALRQPLKPRQKPFKTINLTFRDKLVFKHPQHVIRCVRRKERREVIHALRLTGKGSGARHRRRDEWSNVGCK